MQACGVSQDGVLTTEGSFPTKFELESVDENIKVTLTSEFAKPRERSILMASENELIVSFSPIDKTPKVDDLSDIGYKTPALYRIIYRTRTLQCFKITDKVEYKFFAHRK